VNMFLSLVHTARQATRAESARSRRTNQQWREVPTASSVIGTKS
jgi:hypothetical protein